MMELRELVLTAQQGDQEAFSQLVYRFQDMAYAIGYGKVGDAQLAEDIAQESFLNAYLNLNKLKIPDAFPGWFRTIVLRQCNRFIRRSHFGQEDLALDQMVALSAVTPSPSALTEAKLDQAFVRKSILDLPEPERQVVLLFYLGEYPQKDIAAMLDVRVSTIKNRLFSARNRLRERMLEMVQDQLQDQRPSNNEAFQKRVMNLITAVEEGDEAQVSKLISQEAQLINSQEVSRFGHEKLSPLHLAAMYGFESIAQLLLDHGADINARSEVGWTPLLGALMNNQPDLVSLLLDGQATVDIFAAACLGNMAKLEALLAADPTLVQARGPRQATPLHFASTIPVAELLLRKGADVNACDNNDTARYRYGTPLRWNADNPALAQFLIAQGAEIDDIFLACALGDLAQVQMFMAADAASIYAEKGPYQGNLLHLAADKGHIDIARLILHEGIDVNARTSDGAVTPLHLAAANGHLPMIEFLVSQGADLTATDTEFHGVPLGWAKFWHQSQAVALLEDLAT
ncbi:MAG: sigma-70 family RNA polymerase sigma factor [Chloroflexota bacterium]